MGSKLVDTQDGSVNAGNQAGDGFAMSANFAGEVGRYQGPPSGKVFYLHGARFGTHFGGTDARLEVGGGNNRIGRTFQAEQNLIFDPPLRITDFIRWNVVNGGTAQDALWSISGQEVAE